MFLGKGGKSSALTAISTFWAKHFLGPNIQEACASELFRLRSNYILGYGGGFSALTDISIY